MAERVRHTHGPRVAGCRTVVGLRLTLLVGAIGPVLALVMVFFSPVRTKQVAEDIEPRA